MTVTLDPRLEERIQQEIDHGPYCEPVDVIAHALDLLAAERKDAAAIRKIRDKAFGLWSDTPEDGLAYQDRMRNEW